MELQYKTTEKQDEKAKWSSKFESLVVLLGYSIGLPETWKLPFLVYRNGGGAFLIPYGMCILFCGFPLYFLELALSQFSGYGPWKIWNICPIFRGIGLSIAAVNIITVILDSAVQCWSIEYLINSFKPVLPWTTCGNVWNTEACGNVDAVNSTFFSNDSFVSINASVVMKDLNITWATVVQEANDSRVRVSPMEEFWTNKVLRMSSGIDDIGDINGMYIVYMIIVKIIVFCAIVKSIQSLGKVMLVTAIVPVVLIVVIWVRALTLPGSLDGMLFFIAPDFSKLLNIQIWIEAAFMAFNTLGPGWGGLMMIGCHNKFNFNCFRAAFVSSSAVLIIGLFNGLVVFSTLGVMSYEANVPVDSVITSGGFSIGFLAYPKALSYFPIPQVWCVIFYLVLILPGIDALTVMMEPFLLILEEIFPRSLRNRRVILLTAVTIITFLLGIIFVTQAGVYIFILGIWFVATWNIVLICIIESVVFGWIYGGFRLDRDLRMMMGRPLPAIVRVSLAFLIPLFLTILLVTSLFTYRAPSFGTYHYPGYASVIGWLLTVSTLLPAFGVALYTLRKVKGNLKQKFQNSLRPTKNWKPLATEYQPMFQESEFCSDMTFKQLFLYNLLGKTDREVVQSGSKDEAHSLKPFE